MKKGKVIASIDPSGNFDEGKGKSGLAFIHLDNQYQIKDIALQVVSAKEYASKLSYWHKIIVELFTVCSKYDVHVVCESYQLRESKAKSQSWSHLETPQLIGALMYRCYVSEIPFTLQTPAAAKRVWSDDRLVHEGYLDNINNRLYYKGLMTNDHMRDALRHGLLYISKLKKSS